MTTALEGGEWSAARPGRTLPPGKTQCPFYRRMGGPQGRSGRAENLPPPHWDSIPDRPARSQSLYRLSYRAHILLRYLLQITATSNVFSYFYCLLWYVSLSHLKRSSVNKLRPLHYKSLSAHHSRSLFQLILVINQLNARYLVL